MPRRRLAARSSLAGVELCTYAAGSFLNRQQAFLVAFSAQPTARCCTNRRMHKKWREGNAGRVYSLAKGGQLQEILQGNTITLPNGMAWDESRRVMYFADTGRSAWKH